MAPKQKAQKMGLGDFLADQSLGSWADEMEDAPIQYSRSGYGGERRTFSSAGTFGGGSGGGGDRNTFDRGGMSYAVREQLPLPSKPPYTSHLGNLPFDATEGDIQDFFAGCDVTSIRIVEDKMDRKPKGFGYVEFGTLDGLRKALDLNGEQFQGRGIRISVADPPKDRVEAREITDWSRKGPLPDLPGQGARRASDRAGFGERRGYEGAPDMERGGSRRGAPAFDGDGKSRDFSDWSRKGPLSPTPSAAQSLRDGGRVRSRDGPADRKNSPVWGEGLSQDGSRPPRREFQERPQQVERQPTAAEMDNKWRDRMKPDAPAQPSTPTPEPSQPSSPAHPIAPASRPKLNLTKRTVSEAVVEQGPSSDSKASPFGAARPIDTTVREREVEERRLSAIREKKEAEDKAKEERRSKDGAAKGVSSEKPTDAEENGDEKNGETPKKPVKILSRAEEEEEEVEGDKSAAVVANGDSSEEQSAKPKDFVREPPKGPRGEGAGGSWRPSRGRGEGRGGRVDRGDRGGRGGGRASNDRKTSAPSTPISPKIGSAAETVDEDGFTVVAPKIKAPRGGGRGGGRGVAA